MSVVRLSLDGQQDELVIYEAHTDLAVGSLAGVRAKFSNAGQEIALRRIIDELDASIEGPKLYLGDTAKGEIQITGIRRIITNPYWTEIEYFVLFPPRGGKGEPAKGTYRAIRWNVGVMNGVAVLALTKDGRIIVVREFKHALRQWVWHVMRGVRRRLPSKKLESLRTAGFRECREEAGVRPTDESECFDLGPIFPDSGVLMSQPRLLCVTNVEIDPALVSLDVSEAISGTMALTPAQAVQLLPKKRALQALSCLDDDQEDGEFEDDQLRASEHVEFADAFTGDLLMRAHCHGLISLPTLV